MNKVEFQEFLIAIEYKVRKMVSVIETNKLGEDATSKHHEFMIVIEEKVQDIFFYGKFKTFIMSIMETNKYCE